ncbi:MAG TPA: hypothetical protein VLS85_00270 [Hanamia sp.]|nr:hypothetical protein [Hanamia sp.]
MKVIIYCQTDIYNQVYFTLLKQKHDDRATHKKKLIIILPVQPKKIKKNKICWFTAMIEVAPGTNLFLQAFFKIINLSGCLKNLMIDVQFENCRLLLK